MFEQFMDEYLDEEVESVKQAFEIINRGWGQKVLRSASFMVRAADQPIPDIRQDGKLRRHSE